jgi:hypothetical protein
VTFREFLLENFAGDLEYHPRRAAIYLVLAVGAFCFWFFSPSETKFTTVPLVFALGCLPLTAKGLFLLRKSSEGLGLSQWDMEELSKPENRKSLPSLPSQYAQIVQDFGVGPLFLWPMLKSGKDIDQAWVNPPSIQVFLCGLALFAVGWLVRRLTASPVRPV